jgi:hypothetical protein
MNAREKRRTEAVLCTLCIGLQIVGARWFASSFSIALETVNPHPHRERYDLCLTVESHWTVFPTRPERFPASEAELPDMSLEERLVALARLAGQDIVEVSLGDEAPHLILTFDAGSVFFLNGAHESYECWNIATATEEVDKNWLIVAVPGGQIALFAPRGVVLLE